MSLRLAELQDALANDELIPHFQPIVELRTGKLSGFEVLARWSHPHHGAFLPKNLVELAEGNGLIASVARQVFAKAFCMVAAAPDHFRLSVNLSPVQLAHPDLAEEMESMAAATGFPLNRLTIEITESALLSDLTRAKTVAHELKEIGCRLSLDDFGTGYSSLAHLHALPFDELKIDRCFVNKMTERRESRKIVAAIIGLGHSLGLSTVAEGVETEEQADMLLWLGSELGQGWHYGRPVPFRDMQESLAAPPRSAFFAMPAARPRSSVSSLEAFPTQRLAQLQAIYDGAPVGLCFLDRNLRYVSLNRRLAEMNGASVAQHLGNLVEEMVPEVYPAVEQYLLRALAGEPVAGVEIVKRRRGTTDSRCVLISYQPAFDEAGEVIGISASVMDITEHKQAQAELQEAEFRQRQLVELNRQVPWTMAPDGMDLQMSSKWVHDAPYKSQARQLGWLDSLHPDDLKVATRKMKHALRTGERIDMEYRIQGTEGGWRWMRSRGLPRVDSDGNITRWYGSVEDIHDAKSAALEVEANEITMLNLLKSLPVAVILKEGKTRALNSREHLRSQCNASDAIEVHDLGNTYGHSPATGRTHEYLFLEADPKIGQMPDLSETGLGSSCELGIGLQVVHDLDHAAMERRRLVDILEDFAQKRRQS